MRGSSSGSGTHIDLSHVKSVGDDGNGEVAAFILIDVYHRKIYPLFSFFETWLYLHCRALKSLKVCSPLSVQSIFSLQAIAFSSDYVEYLFRAL
jgi:hypothetical protein